VFQYISGNDEFLGAGFVEFDSVGLLYKQLTQSISQMPPVDRFFGEVSHDQ
jgi:hypothetical protein